MPKKRSKSGEEWLRGRIRELEKENRALKKQLKFLEKKEHIFDDTGSQEVEVASDSEDTYPGMQRKAKEPCHDCGKGFMDEYELLGRVYGTCNICGNRKRLK